MAPRQPGTSRIAERARLKGMHHMADGRADANSGVFSRIDGMLPQLETLYMDIHSHPELSMQENRTAALAADVSREVAAAEAAASGAPRPPEITTLDRYPLNVNDRDASKRVVDAFRAHFGTDRVRETGPAPASEDFGSFGTDWQTPSVFWFVGGTDPELYANAKAANRLNDLPVNHSPMFA